MLSPYRVLDLSDERGIVCGFIFGELGADVICVEPPGGSTARRRGPFADDIRDGERSLFWWAYARNKRSVVLDPESQGDREALLRLVASADVFIESRKPGEMDRQGLGYDELAAINPALVYISISAFGQTGPKAGWAATDLTVLAAGGPLWLYGDEDRSPVRTSVPQAFAHAAAEGTAAALVALHERSHSGLGQHVDISAQQSVTLATQSDIVSTGLNVSGANRAAGGARFGPMLIRLVYPARDGHVSITHVFGSAIGPATTRLMQVVCEEGFCDETLRDKDWIGMTELLAEGKEPFETYELAKSVVSKWTASRTKSELLEIAMERGLLIAPASTMRDVVDSPQLAAREYFQPLERPDGDGKSRQLGGFARFGVGARQPARPAPRIGEHTVEVLGEQREPKRVQSPSSQDGQKTLPLAGVKILDFMWAIAGPMSTRMLADYGAEVIRIESTNHTDACRTMRPYVDNEAGLETAALFHSCNANKTMLTLDLANPSARGIILDLVRWADIVGESFSPGVISKLGFGYDELRAVNPSLIMLSTCLMGQTGPLAKFAGYGNLAAAISGFHEMTGWPDREAAGPFSAYTDYIAPKFNASVLLAALDHRCRTGEGQHIDLSQAETALHFLAPALLDTLVNDRVASRNGNRDDLFAPHGCFAVAGEDKWIAIAVEDDRAWTEFCERLGRRELVTDKRFVSVDDRLKNVVELESIVTELVEGRNGNEIEALLQAGDVACHLVQDAAAAFVDPQLKARGHFVPIEGGGVNSIIEDTRSKLSRTPAQLRMDLPTLGRDNFEVLDKVLGYDGEKITELVIAGVLD
jgi:crotonobetainyl-CoA:carnitine CoA-transferase CaiB-like acyl-CoA transferase